jgi:hypothetical protein
MGKAEQSGLSNSDKNVMYIVCGAGIKLSAASLVIFCANVYCHLSHSTDNIMKL